MTLNIQKKRTGITFAEVLIASTLMMIMAGTVAALAMSVESATTYHRNTGIASQHARVVMDRIQSKMRKAFGNSQFPGIVTFPTTIGTIAYPDTVVVWTPATRTPTNPTGLPLNNELTVYCPSATNPNLLVEITRPATDTTVVPALTNTAAWTALLNTFKTAADSTPTSLTNLLKSAAAGSNKSLGCARFEVMLRPSDTEFTNFCNLTTANQTYQAWAGLNWPQDLYSSGSGQRQVWCRIEVQLLQGTSGATSSAIPFFGSAAFYYDVSKQ